MSRNIDLPPLRLTLYAAAAAALLVGGGLIGYWIGSADAPVPEATAAAPAKRQADGSLVLQRVADPKPPPAPHKLPPGKEIRRITAVTKPKDRPDCPEIAVVTSLVQDGNSIRAVTSSPDGTVLSGSDVVIRPLNLAPPRRVWAAGGAYEPRLGLYGAWLERDIGRFRVGVEVQQRDDATFAAWVRAGISF